MYNFNIEELYKSLETQNRELTKSAFAFGTDIDFISTIDGKVVSNTEPRVSIQHGRALQAIVNLQDALNKACNEIGTLSSRVEQIAIKQHLGIK